MSRNKNAAPAVGAAGCGTGKHCGTNPNLYFTIIAARRQ